MSSMNTLLVSAPVLANSFALDKDTVTPGVLGFLAIFAIGVALYFLMRSMTGKLLVVRGEQSSDEAIRTSSESASASASRAAAVEKQKDTEK